jgi:enamidase
MASLLVTGLGGLVTGDWTNPLRSASSIYCEDGVVQEIDGKRTEADTVVDARGLLAVPGLVDSHSHPTFGDFAPSQNSVGWLSAYLHGGSTTLISSGESQVPGFPTNPTDARLCKYLAILIKRFWDNIGMKAPRLVAGTLLLVPGLTESDLDEVAEQGIRCAKFLFYPFERNIEEAASYARMCRERGIIVKLHAGGVSGSGHNFPADARVITKVLPDVVAHINGGPIAMTLADMEAVIMGSDTPSPSGIIPRLLWRTIAGVSSTTDIPPEVAVCMATGNTAKAHRLDVGFIQEGSTADFLLVGTVKGSSGADVLDALTIGDIPGISCVVVGGELVVEGRSRITPPPQTLAVVERRS